MSVKDRLKKLLKRAVPEVERNPGQVIRDLSQERIPTEQVDEKLSETLYWLDKLKNSTTVKTGEFEALTRLYTGQKIYVDTRDVSESPHIMLEGIREENVTKAFRRVWQSHFVFFDVGANYGYYPLLAGTDIDKQGNQLHLFEPNPDLIPLLEKSMSVNGLTSTSVINQLALGDSTGTITLHRIKNLWGGSTVLDLDTLKTYRPVEDEFDATFDVKMTTIDDYVKKGKINRVDLIKIDVEGFEDAVYRGMRSTIKQNEELVVFIEFTFGAYQDAKKFFDMINDDFQHVYGVLKNGSFSPINSLDDAKNAAQSEWLMIVASNNDLI